MTGVSRVRGEQDDVLAYLKADLVHNVLEVWSLKYESNRHELYVHRDDGGITAHLSIYHSPEADYIAIGGDESAASRLVHLVPKRAIVLLSQGAFAEADDRLRSGTVYKSNLMLLERGQERLIHPELAVRLTQNDAEEYAGFGPSFTGPPSPLEWARERLGREATYGVFDGKLVSVATTIVPLEEMAVVIGVETKEGYRGKGYGSSVTSAATREGLARAEKCLLGVSSDNAGAKSIYGRLGFRKVSELLWVDVGAALSP
jgi:ribosomal protein S18 acetylase RimI-like enzyme